jgi:hypothetical protein
VQQLDRAIFCRLQAGVVPGSHKLSAEGQGMTQEILPAHLAVANQAWVGGDALGIAFQEGFHHRFPEELLGVDGVEGDPQA